MDVLDKLICIAFSFALLSFYLNTPKWGQRQQILRTKHDMLACSADVTFPLK